MINSTDRVIHIPVGLKAFIKQLIFGPQPKPGKPYCDCGNALGDNMECSECDHPLSRVSRYTIWKDE